MSGVAGRARTSDRVVLGVVESVSIPAWHVAGLDARVDTGAQTSALHVERLEELGNGRVRFALQNGKKKSPAIEATISRRGRVRSTSGKTESRIFVAVPIELGGTAYRAEIGLVDRRHMQFRMLLGRSALAGRFLVDPARRFVLGR